MDIQTKGTDHKLSAAVMQWNQLLRSCRCEKQARMLWIPSLGLTA